ncbi:serine hydrolase [Catalinimonas sp. 4WD22]|uniref:serine hydrolase domain-containing protein n=1 Tax=Catalinimonas locisalis TaxID=3133978 RepID=UPI003100F903
MKVSLASYFSRQAFYHPFTGCTLHKRSPFEKSTDKAIAHPAIQTKDAEANVNYIAGEKRFWDKCSTSWMQTSPSHTLALVIMQGGKCVIENYATEIQKETPLAGWSMAKSVVNAWVGIMVKKGLLQLHEPLPKEIWQGNTERREITMHHLLQMSSGLPWSERYWWRSDVTNMLFSSEDVGRAMAAKHLRYEPGTKWQYASGTSNLISKALRIILKDDYTAFPYRELFAPLGMETALMEADASGNFVGSSYMLASARDWAKFGLLYAQDGIWKGERILPEGWVDYTISPAEAAPFNEYGAHFWLNEGIDQQAQTRKIPDAPPDVFYASGFGGQRVFIVPSHELVIARLGSAHFKEPNFNVLLSDLLANLDHKQDIISKTDINHNL